MLSGEEDSEEQEQKCEQAKEVISKVEQEDKDKEKSKHGKEKDDSDKKSDED